MIDNKRNCSSGIFVLLLMFIFFSFIHEEKERQITGRTTQPSVISDAYNAGLQAIISPETSTPESGFYRINPINAKFGFSDCTSIREFVFNNLIAQSFNSSQLKFPFRKPIIDFVFPQKVPEQGKEDDIPSIT